MVSIIKYLHKNNVIIRNLRPETIMFEEKESYDIKLVDLSLAMEKKYYKEGHGDTMFEEYQRLPIIFRPPELLTTKKRYSELVDIWSCGCIIFNMVTGIPPFYDYDKSALINLILYGKYTGYFPEFDSSASKDLQNLIAHMIVLDSEKRITADGLVTDPWINSAH